MTPEEIERIVSGPEFRAKWESLISRGTTTGACWQMKKDKRDRQQINLPGFSDRTVSARQVSWFYSRGTWPEKYITTTCKTDGCFNPDHLAEGRGYLPQPKAKKQSTAFASLAREYAETIRMVSSRQDWSAMNPEDRADVGRELRALRLAVSQVIKIVERTGSAGDDENAETD